MSDFDPRALEPHVIQFLTERHLATLTTIRRDGSSHVVPVGFTYDPETALARVITSGASVKARNAERMTLPAAICQVDGGRWLTVQGPIRLERDPAAVTNAEERYAVRYRVPRVNPLRVVLIIDVTRILGSVRPPA